MNGLLRAARLAMVVVVGASVLLASSPAQAGGPWTDRDLTRLVGGFAGDAPYGFVTDLPEEGPMIRVVYRSIDFDVVELSLRPGGIWQARQLTLSGAVDSAPVGFMTTLDGEGPVAHIVFAESTGRIMELSKSGKDDWALTDLTVLSGGSPWTPGSGFYNITAFNSALPGQPATAHVLYPDDYDLRELSVTGGAPWRADTVTWISDVYTRGFGYVTTLFGQAPTERFVYGNVGWGIRELTTDGFVLHGSELTARAGLTTCGPLWPFPYTTHLPGQGEVARVVFYTADCTSRGFYIGELSTSNGNQWQSTRLSPAGPNGSWSEPAAPPMGFTSTSASGAQTARVVYLAQNSHIIEISSTGGPWGVTDLSASAGVPRSGDNAPALLPMGFATNLPGEGPMARVLYSTRNGEIHELSRAG